MKRSSVSALQDLEKLLTLVEKKSKDQTLLKILNEAKVRGTQMRSLQDV